MKVVRRSIILCHQRRSSEQATGALHPHLGDRRKEGDSQEGRRGSVRNGGRWKGERGVGGIEREGRKAKRPVISQGGRGVGGGRGGGGSEGHRRSWRFISPLTKPLFEIFNSKKKKKKKEKARWPAGCGPEGRQEEGRR